MAVAGSDYDNLMMGNYRDYLIRAVVELEFDKKDLIFIRQSFKKIFSSCGCNLVVIEVLI